MKLLVMEDNPEIALYVKLGLEKHDCFVDLAYDSAMAEKLAFQKKYDVMILDVMVPGINGFDLCKRIRNHNIQTPILMLTSRDSTQDKVTGFDCGADDYLLKPFEFQELLARIKALERRSKGSFTAPSLQISNLVIDIVTKKVHRGDMEIKLTTREFKILHLLANQKGKVFDRLEIIDKIWGTAFNTGTNVVDVHINALRNKIDKNFDHKLIHTIIGMGYKLDDKP